MNRAFSSISQGACTHPVSVTARVALGVVIGCLQNGCVRSEIAAELGPVYGITRRESTIATEAGRRGSSPCHGRFVRKGKDEG